MNFLLPPGIKGLTTKSAYTIIFLLSDCVTLKIWWTVIIFLSQETRTCNLFYTYPLLLFSETSNRFKSVRDLDGKDVWLHSHAPAHAIYEYVANLKHSMVCFSVFQDLSIFALLTVMNDNKATSDSLSGRKEIWYTELHIYFQVVIFEEKNLNEQFTCFNFLSYSPIIFHQLENSI